MHVFFLSLIVFHVHAHIFEGAAVPPVQLTAGRKLSTSLLENIGIFFARPIDLVEAVYIY